MESKITIGQAIAFMNFSKQWMSSTQNTNSPLGICIQKVSPQIDFHLQEIMKFEKEHFRKIDDEKNRYADKVTIAENSQTPQHSISTYEYKGTELVERNRILKSMNDRFDVEHKAMEAIEITIEPHYVKNVPPDAILPPMFVTHFRRIVIEPEWTPDRKVLMGKA